MTVKMNQEIQEVKDAHSVKFGVNLANSDDQVYLIHLSGEQECQEELTH